MVPAQRVDQPRGLTSADAEERRQQFGPNTVPEKPPQPIRLFLRKFAAPVPLMLEATLAIELALGHYVQGTLISVLLVLNAIISFLQERRANAALGELRASLAVNARALRDGRWVTLPAAELVPDDVVYLRAGDIVPADVRILDGHMAADRSALTGESVPVELDAASLAESGCVIRRGEAAGVVVATGARTASGKVAELIGAAQPKGHIEQTVVGVVKYLVAGDALLAAAVLVHAWWVGAPFADALSFALMLLIASVPVALPATFSLALAIGSHELARRGVLVTRLAAAEDIACMTVLCTDKTGTLTENRLTVYEVVSLGMPREEVLGLAASACDSATQDPIDLAIITATRDAEAAPDQFVRIRFVPFDPESKRAEAYGRRSGTPWHVIKGAPAIVASLTGETVPSEQVARLARQGCRVLAVAAGPERSERLAGLVGLRDTRRPDAAEMVDKLRGLNVRVVMASGDDPATAAAVAREVGIEERDVFGGVSPADKVALIRRWQSQGAIVGMTGDGVNDAAALKQAEAGIAMSTATDVAKSAASMVLIESGLIGVVEAIRAGRSIYRRMAVYTLNKIVKTFHLSVLLTAGVLFLHEYVATSRQLVLLLLINDFLTMSLSADRASPSARPARWDLRRLSLEGFALAAVWIAASLLVWHGGRVWFGLTTGQLQTLTFVTLVVTCQANVLLVRTQQHFWRSRPGRWVLLSCAGGLMVAACMAWFGLLMPPVRLMAIASACVLVGVLAVALNIARVAVLLVRHVPPSPAETPSVAGGLA